MHQTLDETLCARYPAIFAQRHGDPAVGCMTNGIEVGDGWFGLIDALCECLQQGTDLAGEPQVVAVQVKEKPGTLRFRAWGINDRQRGMIDFVQHLSARLCPDCGQFLGGHGGAVHHCTSGIDE